MIEARAVNVTPPRQTVPSPGSSGCFILARRASISGRNPPEFRLRAEVLPGASAPGGCRRVDAGRLRCPASASPVRNPSVGGASGGDRPRCWLGVPARQRSPVAAKGASHIGPASRRHGSRLPRAVPSSRARPTPAALAEAARALPPRGGTPTGCARPERGRGGRQPPETWSMELPERESGNGTSHTGEALPDAAMPHRKGESGRFRWCHSATNLALPRAGWSDSLQEGAAPGGLAPMAPKGPIHHSPGQRPGESAGGSMSPEGGLQRPWRRECWAIGVARSLEAPRQGAVRAGAFPRALPGATLRSARWAWRGGERPSLPLSLRHCPTRDPGLASCGGTDYLRMS